MPFFQVEAIDQSGNSKRERVEAGNEQEAIKQIQKRNLVVVDLRPAENNAPIETEGKAAKVKHVPTQLVLSFYEQLAFLIKSGIPMFLAIRMLSDTLRQPAMAQILKTVMFDLSEGFPLSNSLQKYPEVFNGLHTNLIAVGEKSGNLDYALSHLVELVREAQDIREKIIKAAAYPVFLLVLSLSLVLGLLMHVFPKFEEIFKAFNAKLPWYTEMLITTSQQLRSNSLLIFSGVGIVIVGVVYFFRSEQMSLTRDKFFLKIPVIQDVFVSMFVALFAKTLCSLLKSGIPLLEGLTICQNTIKGQMKNMFFSKLIETVREGDKVSKAMEGSLLIPEMARQLIIVGETTGNLDIMLDNVFQFYKKRYNEMLNKSAAIIQPILLFFAAGLIAIVAISLFVPLFKLGSNMRSGG